MSVNKAILVGNVGKDPEIRGGDGPDDHRVAVLYLATSDRWRDKATKAIREKTEWHKVVVLSSGLVGIVEKLVRKGTRLYVEGMIQTRRWVDHTNTDRTSTEIVLQGFNNKMAILDRAKRSSGDYGNRSDDDYDGGEEYGLSDNGNDSDFQSVEFGDNSFGDNSSRGSKGEAEKKPQELPPDDEVPF